MYKLLFDKAIEHTEKSGLMNGIDSLKEANEIICVRRRIVKL